MNVTAILFGSIGLVFAAILVRAWVLTELWGWFIVPTFGVAAINMPVALGISLTVALFTQHLQHDKTEENPPTTVAGILGHILGKAIFAPLITWVFGWIIQSFM